MANFFKLQLPMILSPNTNLTDEEWSEDWDAYQSEASEVMRSRVVVGTSVLLFTLDDWFVNTSPVLIAVKNLDTTNYVTAEWADLDTAGSDSTEHARIPANRTLILPGVAAGSAQSFRLTANTAAVTCQVLMAQMEDFPGA